MWHRKILGAHTGLIERRRELHAAMRGGKLTDDEWYNAEAELDAMPSKVDVREVIGARGGIALEVSPRCSERTMKAALEVGAWINGITNKRLHVRVESTRNPGYHGFVSSGIVHMNYSTAGAPTLAHELGHLLEEAWPEEAAAWQRRGDLPSGYAHKAYHAGGTEVTSCALEALWVDPVQLASAFPDLTDWLIEALLRP